MPRDNAVERFVLGYRDPGSGRPADPNTKQYAAHISEADELLYGGAAFGGKSEYIIQEAVATCLKYPGCEVAVFRRSHTELEHSLVQRFLRYVPRYIAKYAGGSKKCATFYNGSILWFCHCRTAASVFRYQSDEWVGLFIDQAEHFTESMVTYLMTRVRTSRPGVRCKIRLTANPGGIGHAWLKARYIAPPPEVIGERPLPGFGEVWAPLPNPAIPDDKPMSRQFIQALMTDNVPGMLADPGYVQKIRANPSEMTRRMLELGDWDAFEGQMFDSWRANKLVTTKDAALLDAGLSVGDLIPWHTVPDPYWRPPAGAFIFGSVDYGYGNPWSTHFHAVTGDGHIVTFKEFYATKVRDREQAQRIRHWLEEEWALQDQARRPRWHVPYIVGDIPFGSRMEHGLAKSVFEVYEDVLAIPLKLNLQHAPKGPGSRKARVQRTLDAFSPAPDGFPWAQITTACPNAIRTIPQLIVDPNDLDDILHGVGEKKQEDHAYDDISTFYSSRPPFPKPEATRENRNDLGVGFGAFPPSRPAAPDHLDARAFARYQ